MKHVMELSDEQFQELDMILRRELRESKGELRHTWDAGYKERVKHHIEMVESMVESIESMRAPASEPASSR